jgi:hypothetical protein
LEKPQLVFDCAYDTEDLGIVKDRRFVQISANDFISRVADHQLATIGGSGPSQCSSMRGWHRHVIPLDSAWGNVKIRFHMDTMDGKFNIYTGWFVDEVRVLSKTLRKPRPNGGRGGDKSSGSAMGCQAQVGSATFDAMRPKAWWVAVFGIVLLLTFHPRRKRA